MGVRKRMPAVILGLAFAGIIAITVGPAVPAGAQTTPTAPRHAALVQGCGDWDGWGDDCGDDGDDWGDGGNWNYNSNWNYNW
jgi:hypothetical protein